jgi:hypothetical protein
MNTKYQFAKILGEIYRIQNRTGVPCAASEATVYGLLNGIEKVIDEQIEDLREISSDKVDAVVSVLEPYWQDPKKLEEFTGFYAIERELADRGVSRGDAIPIIIYLKADHRFEEVIEKMNSKGSPIECTTFELDEFYK